MKKLDTIGKKETILGDLFERQPEALKTFSEETANFSVVVEGDPNGKLLIDIWNSKKRLSFTCKSDEDIEVLVDDLKAELIDLGIKLQPPSKKRYL